MAGRLKTLEARPAGLRYCGVWQRSVSYAFNEGATHAGNLWVCLIDGTRGVVPGGDPAAWQLCVKGGTQ